MTVTTTDAATGLSERFGRAIADLLPRHVGRLT